MAEIFTPDPRIEADSVFVADMALCQVRLMDDARFAWLMLLPRRAGLVEITDLDEGERTRLMAEIAACADALRGAVDCDKLNIGALGNVVPQLHVHVVARTRGDAAWPGPVWGSGPRHAYPQAARDGLIRALAETLSSGA